MKITTQHRRVARALWKSGGRVDEAAGQAHVRPGTVLRWLMKPEFRRLVDQATIEPLLQATSAMRRWAPAAVARLIRDLQSESSVDARQAAKEILKLALDAEHYTPRKLRRPAGQPGRPADAAGAPGLPDDPLGRRVAALDDDQLARVLALINEAGDAVPDRGGGPHDPNPTQEDRL
jgi:hypothetical protein